MSTERLYEIGNELASLWGGSCYNFTINQKEKQVVFACIEHGEKFSAVLPFSEIKRDYGLDLSKKQQNRER